MTAMYRRDDNTSFAAQLANNNVACRLLLSSNIKVKLMTPFLVLFDDIFCLLKFLAPSLNLVAPSSNRAYFLSLSFL